jgi:hypothetical protein
LNSHHLIETINGKKQVRKFKAEDYRDKILKTQVPKIRQLFVDNGIDDDDWIFQQDGDAKHRSNLVQHWCSNNISSWFEKDEWPANSPDLSIIENCWSAVWEELRSYKNPPQTKDILKSRIIKAWRSRMTSEYIQKLYDSIPNRMNEVTKHNGLPTTY